jgi:hypothetical protein
MQKGQNGPAATTPNPATGNFAVGPIMVITSGVLSAGWGFAFSYSQGPIIEAGKARGAPDFFAKVSVWPIILLGAALVIFALAKTLAQARASKLLIMAGPPFSPRRRSGECACARR